jgi:hypothetical protein
MSNPDDIEADLIIEKLKKTDAEREAEVIEELKKYVEEFAAMIQKNNIDEKIVGQIQGNCLNKIEELFPELKK